MTVTEILKSLPYLAVVGFVLLCIGDFLVFGGLTSVIAFIEDASGLAGQDLSSSLARVEPAVLALISLTLVTGVFALIISLLTRGPLREKYCKSAMRGGQTGCIAVLKADCAPRFITITAFVLFLVLLLLVVLFTLMAVVIAVLQAACAIWESDSETRAALQDLLTQVAAVDDSADDTNEDISASFAKIDALCANFDIGLNSAGLLLAGGLSGTVGMVLLLMSLNSSVAYAAMERKRKLSMPNIDYKPGTTAEA